MKRIIILTIFLSAFILVLGCTNYYSHATISIKNNTSTSLSYKGYQKDTKHGTGTYEIIIKILSPASSPLIPGATDSIDVDWAISTNGTSADIAISWGMYDPTPDVYDYTTSYYSVNDGETRLFIINDVSSCSVY